MDLFWLGKAFDLYLRKASIELSVQKSLDLVERSLREMKRGGYFGSEHLDIKTTIARVITVLKKQAQADDQEDLPLGWFRFREYYDRLRDFRIYAPKIKQSVLTETGTKGVILGKDHIDTVKLLLYEQINSQYPSWSEYKRQIDEKSRRGIEMLEAVVNK